MLQTWVRHAAHTNPLMVYGAEQADFTAHCEDQCHGSLSRDAIHFDVSIVIERMQPRCHMHAMRQAFPNFRGCRARSMMQGPAGLPLVCGTNGQDGTE
jgi:hypothetical protein